MTYKQADKVTVRVASALGMLQNTKLDDVKVVKHIVTTI